MNCERCPHMAKIKAAMLPCQSCDEAHVRNRVQATDYTIAQRKLDDHTPTTGVTNLAPDDEDKLRKAMSNLFGLDPIDLLLVQHLFKGRSLASFGDTLQSVHKQVHFYAPSATRSMAHAKKEAIERIFPQIKPVFKHAIDPTAPVDGDPDEIGHLVESHQARENGHRSARK